MEMDSNSTQEGCGQLLLKSPICAKKICSTAFHHLHPEPWWDAAKIKTHQTRSKSIEAATYLK